jgi:hypothetical protein
MSYLDIVSDSYSDMPVRDNRFQLKRGKCSGCEEVLGTLQADWCRLSVSGDRDALEKENHSRDSGSNIESEFCFNILVT